MICAGPAALAKQGLGDTAASSPRTVSSNPVGCSHRLNIQSDQAVTSFFRCPGPMTLRSTFLDSEDVMRGQIGTAGFRILEWKNYSSRVIARDAERPMPMHGGPSPGAPRE
jgi:hypothetical protein